VFTSANVYVTIGSPFGFGAVDWDAESSPLEALSSSSPPQAANATAQARSATISR
jgi:hypothetical protein